MKRLIGLVEVPIGMEDNRNKIESLFIGNEKSYEVLIVVIIMYLI